MIVITREVTTLLDIIETETGMCGTRITLVKYEEAENYHHHHHSTEDITSSTDPKLIHPLKLTYDIAYHLLTSY